MGNSNNSECALSTAEIESCCKATVFTADEVRALWYHFQTINSSSGPTQQNITRR